MAEEEEAVARMPTKRNCRSTNDDDDDDSDNESRFSDDDGEDNDRIRITPRHLLDQVTVGTKLEIYWQDDDAYYPGVVAAHCQLPKDMRSYRYNVLYDDGEVETVDLSRQRFRIIGGKTKQHQHSNVVVVQSLTVRFDQRKETWRSPPTYCGQDDFIWPAGWIEVQRLVSTQEDNDGHYNNNNNDMQQKSSPSKRGKKKQQLHWVREFHPPCKKKANQKGRITKICHSIDEVKTYIQQQKAKQLQQERFTGLSNSPPASRRSSGRRKVNPNQNQSLHQSLLTLGSQAELNKIMKRNDKLSAKMRQAILYGAVLARKKGILETDNGFLGANGRMYPDLRKAFGKHVNMKQCSLCKSRVQGHWFCRITHSHLDKPDYDGGGNSAECLIELFRGSIEGLEARLWSLLPGGKESCSNTIAASTREGFESSDWSMSNLSEDLLYQIASFLPTLSQLVSFCKTSKRSQHLLYRSVHSEKLFRGVFLRAFGEQGTRGNFERDLSWRERWFMIRDLRRGLVQDCIRPPSAMIHQLKETIGVLPTQDEREAIFYDNPEHADPQRAYCNGYFGLERLYLPRPPNAGSDWQPPIIVRGDFNGIKIFSSMSLFYRNQNGRGQMSRASDAAFTLGDDEGGGQVLSLIHCDLNDQESMLIDPNQPCCFIGYASGRVAAVSATLTECKSKYALTIAGEHHAHGSEVTDLAFVNCSSSEENKNVPVLFSSCCDGMVYFYPNAMNPEQNFSMDQSVLAFTNHFSCPIFSMASTTIYSRGKSFSILCTGDRDGNVR